MFIEVEGSKNGLERRVILWINLNYKQSPIIPKLSTETYNLLQLRERERKEEIFKSCKALFKNKLKFRKMYNEGKKRKERSYRMSSWLKVEKFHV